MGMHWVVIMINHIHILFKGVVHFKKKILSFTLTIHKISTSYPVF